VNILTAEYVFGQIYSMGNSFCAFTFLYIYCICAYALWVTTNNLMMTDRQKIKKRDINRLICA